VSAQPKSTLERVERIAIIGAGTMGASWPAAFSEQGRQVRLYNPAPGWWGCLKRYGVSTGPRKNEATNEL
jgi:3-hydroxyacyl-CoA dehydrogenase